jgi:hypothetical protein
MPDVTTLLGVLVNLFDGTSSQEDSLFFFTTEPTSQADGTCVSDGSFNDGDPITSLGDSLTSEQFSACVSDIGVLQSAYTAMCSR